MIIFHYRDNDPESDRIWEKLDKLVISFEAIAHDSDDFGSPFIEEDGEKFKPGKELSEWFSELEAELKWQRSLSGDGCYINPEDGKIC